MASFSVVIAAYNEAKTIAKTIENALSLDWPKNKLEIIVIENNGSTDGTYEIAKRYEKRGVKVINVSSGIGGWRRPRSRVGEGYLVNDAQKIQKQVKINHTNRSGDGRILLFKKG